MIGYGSNDNRLRIEKRVESMVCHSDCKYLNQRLLLAIINFLGPITIAIKRIWMYHFSNWTTIYLKFFSLPLLYCTTSVVLPYLALQYQCCIVA